MHAVEWKPMPVRQFLPPSVTAEIAGDLCLAAFSDYGIPTWEVRRKIDVQYGLTRQRQWQLVAYGTADSIEAAKLAALQGAELL